MNLRIANDRQLQPGTELRVHSNIVGVMHWGVVGYHRDSQGNPMVWHSQKSDVLRQTSFDEFSYGKPYEILHVPANNEEAMRIVERLAGKEGLPWHLFKANCEMVARWAVEDRAVSHQLAFAILTTVAVLAVVTVTASNRR